jgi:hypothetical protein
MMHNLKPVIIIFANQTLVNTEHTIRIKRK